jgi:hypothetical protein
MSRSHRLLARAGAAALAVGMASLLPAGAAFAAPAPPHDQPGKGNTPACLVGAALLYPFFVGNILFTDPASVPSALPGYWTGYDKGGQKGGDGGDDHFHGWISGCGVSGLPGGITPPKAG